MNTYQAKRIPLPGILARLGCQPVRTVKGEHWYLSPFRKEAEASFKVNPERNIWYDFGAGHGGNVLDFVMQYYQLTTIAEALRRLESLEGWQRMEPAAPSPAPALSGDLRVTKVQPLQNRALIHYLEERGIGAANARPYVQEMYYTRGDKHYFALAFPNDSGGYELRNPYFKGAHGSKDISLIASLPAGNAASVAVFEGFMDFLSWLVHTRTPRPALPVLVLNSVATKDRAIAVIRDLHPQSVRLFLDHDASGRKLSAEIAAQLPGIAVSDQSELYAGCKDFNEWLVKQRHRNRIPG
jgi:hypothetical protein